MEKDNNGFGKIWILICVPVISLIINIILSEFQELFGYECIIISTIFIFLIILVFYFGLNKCSSMFAIDVFVPKFSNEIKTFSEKLIDRMECKSVEGIVTERTLSQIESSTSAQEIWIASNDLNTELEGYIGDYVDVVQANLERGIIYRIFYPKGGHANAMRVEQMKRSHNYHPNFYCYEVSDEFFFLVEGMDFTIYDPYKNNRSGRRGYLGFLPPDSDEMYAIKVNNDLVDAVASKLLVYVKDSSSGGKASKQKNKK